MAINRIEVGWIWESVPDEPQKFYEIMSSNSEEIRLRRLVDNQYVNRYVGQVTKFGLTRPKRRGE